MSVRKKSTVGFWFAVTLFAVLVMYPLSKGPYILISKWIPEPLKTWTSFVFAPVDLAMIYGPNSFAKPYLQYLRLWKPLYADAMERWRDHEQTGGISIPANSRLDEARESTSDNDNARTAELPPMSASSPWSFGAEQKVRLLSLRLRDEPEMLSQRERFIWVLQWFYLELENGGTDQVFFNTGEYATDAIEAFESIGAPASAATLRRICSLFPGGRPSRDEIIRRQQMVQIRERTQDGFDQFDGQWFNEDVFDLLLEYWKAHEPTADETPQSQTRQNEAIRLFVELPVINKGDYDELADRERYLWDVCFFSALSEGKGNVSTFFVAPEGEHAIELLTALDKIRARRTAAIVRKVCGFYPSGRPSSDILQRLDIAAFQKAKSEFGDVEIHDGVVKQNGDEEDLFALLLHYWKRRE